MSGTAISDHSALDDDPLPSPQSAMIRKLKACLQVLGHTLLALVAALVAGFSFHSFLRPLMGPLKYSVLAETPLMILLMLTVIAFWGILLYYRWRDHHAFYAWVLPAIWCLYLLLSRGSGVFRRPTRSADLASFFLEIGLAYSAGAVLSAMVFRLLAGKSVH
jgi:uncharacterized membrane protein